MSEEKRTVMEKIAGMFAEKNENEKAFILGYMVAVEQQKQLGQQVVTA